MASAHLLRAAPSNNNGQHHHRRSTKDLGYRKILPRIPVSLVEENSNVAIHPAHSLLFPDNVGPTAETGQQQHHHRQQQQQQQQQPSLGNYRYNNKTYHYQHDVTKDTIPSWKSSVSTPPFHFPKSVNVDNKMKPPFHFPKSDTVDDATGTNYSRTNHHHHPLLVQTQNLPAISPLGRKQAAATLSSKKFFDETEVLSIDDTTTVHDNNDECTVVVMAHPDDDDHWSLGTFPCNSTGSLSQTEKQVKYRRVTGSPYGITVTAKRVAWKYDDYYYANHSKDNEDIFDDMSSVLHIEQHMNLSDFSHLLDSNCQHHPAATEEEKRTKLDHSFVHTNHHNQNHHHQQDSKQCDAADDDGDNENENGNENDTINSTEFVLHIIEKKNNDHEDDISCISEMSSTMRY